MKKILTLLLLFCINIPAMDLQKRKITIIKKANRYTKKYDLEALQRGLINAQRLLDKNQKDLNFLAQELENPAKKEFFKKLLHREERLEIIKAGIKRAIEMKITKIQKGYTI